MDWGIVASVVIANLLLILGILLFAVFMISLFVSGMKKKAKDAVSASKGPVDQEPTGVVRSCPIAFCPMNKVVELT